jgi:hypothetical protein
MPANADQRRLNQHNRRSGHSAYDEVRKVLNVLNMTDVPLCCAWADSRHRSSRRSTREGPRRNLKADGPAVDHMVRGVGELD